MRRALSIVRAQLRASMALGLQYRLEFLVEGGLAVLWMAVTLIPLLVVFGTRQAVEGWTFPEMLLVLGWFVALKGVLEGAVSPSLTAVIEHVRKGTLDFVLLKPASCSSSPPMRSSWSRWRSSSRGASWTCSAPG